MSIASPKNRDEFKSYILSKLGHPVLQVNVADEQLDIAINDAFQYWNERSHFLGTERVYLTWPITTEFVDHFASFEHNLTAQGPGPSVRAPGMVDELEITSPGTKYSYDPEPAKQTEGSDSVELEANPTGDDITTELGVDLIIDTAGGSGKDLTVWVGEERTELMGLVKVKPYNAGTGYEVGDIITINGTSGNPAIATVTKIKSQSKVFGVADIRTQNNFITMPDDVVGINRIFHRNNLMGGGGMLGGIIPGAAIGPMFLGGLLGGNMECNNIGYDIVSYVAMREYMATIGFLFFPPIQYNFNQRTHRLFIEGNQLIADGMRGGGYMCVEAMVKPSPDLFPDVWNDMWLKEYAVALTQLAWGRNLTKYNQVNLPGGITMNGEAIKNEAMDNIKLLRERFALDWADPPLDLVG